MNDNALKTLEYDRVHFQTGDLLRLHLWGKKECISLLPSSGYDEILQRRRRQGMR